MITILKGILVEGFKLFGYGLNLVAVLFAKAGKLLIYCLVGFITLIIGIFYTRNN